MDSAFSAAAEAVAYVFAAGFFGQSDKSAKISSVNLRLRKGAYS